MLAAGAARRFPGCSCAEGLFSVAIEPERACRGSNPLQAMFPGGGLSDGRLDLIG